MSDDLDTGISLNINVSRKGTQFGAKTRISGNRGQRIKARRSLKQLKTKNNEAGLTLTEEHVSHENYHGKVVDEENKSEKAISGDTGQRPDKQKKSGPVISSLFSHNPDVPELHSDHVVQVREYLFSSDSFQETPLHPYMKSNLEKLGFSKMTAVQHQAIPLLVAGRDVLVQSQTGSGKTMSYAIPIIEDLCKMTPKIQRCNGCIAVVIVPTRELAIQSYEVFLKLLKPFTWLVPGCIMGGEKRKAEKARLRKGINILVATPGRLIDHIENTKNLLLDRIKWLVLDEADRLLDLGFEQKVSNIIQAINKQNMNRQTVLLSATLSHGVEKLAGISLNDPERVSVTENRSSSKLYVKSEIDDGTKKHTTLKDASKREEKNEEKFALPDSLKQYFVVTPCKLRLVVLLILILTKCKRELHKKMIVFTSTQDGVEFLYRLVQYLSKCESNDSDVEDEEPVTSLDVYRLHGHMAQKDRTTAFQEFCSAKSGLLLCTDVAARGLHLPFVEWVIQYTCPSAVTDYVHRVGRTARVGTSGSSIIFILPSEIQFIKHLNEHHISLEELKLGKVLEDVSKLIPSLPGVEDTERQPPKTIEESATYLQNCCELYVKNGTDMASLAKRAYQSTIRAYATYPHQLKSIFQIRNLHLGHVAKTFGLREAPSDIGHVSGVTLQKGKRKNFEPEKRFKTKKQKLDVSEYRSPLVLKSKLKVKGQAKKHLKRKKKQ
ncbi:probable ATP-dependent RNA helicase DDX31 [Ruditapes philippinarum]|uniref:probable ATP-dependent RNA helicase DDX31 n=1 Tax=Ruditapes philippinarum TaxID=129788 RepID=UPI00295B592B|nr:probable ATP-dependent RNA helicase DDX31 [Ruditapes philippinarum]